MNNVNNLKTTTIENGTSNLHVVSIVKYASDQSTSQPYNPSPLTISRGTTVTWTNNDSAPHTVTEGTAADTSSGHKFDSGIFGPGQTFKQTFDQVGVINYYCSIHPFMSGEVIVK